jgi:probable rRNA maturation factor
VSIQIVFEDIKPLKVNKNFIKNSIKKLITNEIKIAGNISVIVCSDLFLLEINKQYLQHDYYTDIITFNYCEGEIISGDLFISIDRVEENAKIFEKPVMHEFYRVIFHGILHLTGYNDKTEAEQRVMRQKEDFYLSEVDFGGIGK